MEREEEGGDGVEGMMIITRIKIKDEEKRE